MKIITLAPLIALEKGAIDMIVDRRQMSTKIAQLVTLLQKEPAPVVRAA